MVGGKTNRAKLEFEQEMNRLLNTVPELVNTNDLGLKASRLEAEAFPRSTMDQ